MQSIKPKDRTKYLVKFRGQEREAWYMGDTFIFNNYYQTKEATIIERLGSEEEVFK